MDLKSHTLAPSKGLAVFGIQPFAKFTFRKELERPLDKFDVMEINHVAICAIYLAQLYIEHQYHALFR